MRKSSILLALGGGVISVFVMGLSFFLGNNSYDFLKADVTHNGLTYGTITSSVTGQVWLDRNLGASQVCTSHSDSACYGTYYNFPSDNICPAGFKLPTQSNFTAEAFGEIGDAFSRIKIPLAGEVDASSGATQGQGIYANVWLDGSSSNNNYYIDAATTSFGTNSATNGFSVRCIEDPNYVSPTPTPSGTVSNTSASGTSCAGPDGVTLLDGQSKTYYSKTEDESCSSVAQVRTCNDGVLEGDVSHQYASCTEPDKENCAGPDGITLVHGQSKKYYSETEAEDCSVLSLVRTCNDGVLEGDVSYQYASCTDYDSCTGPDGSVIPHGQFQVYYKNSKSLQCDLEKQNRSCDKGVLSGSFTHSVCETLEDTDNDGITDEDDDDDDGDGVLDVNDAFPLDKNEFVDTDGDGIGNNADTDDDGDGVSDIEEIQQGSDPLSANSVPGRQTAYPLCELWTEDDNKVHWSAQDYTVNVTTVTNSGGAVQQNPDAVIDPLHSGQVVCTATGENVIEEFLSVIPEEKFGTLPLPQGFPFYNDLECTLTVKTVAGVESSCRIHQKLVSLDTVGVNGESKAWHFPVSVLGEKKIPMIYGGNSHEIYSASDATGAVVKHNQLVLVTDKKGNEGIEWSSPDSDVGYLKHYETDQICTSQNPCTDERVIFMSGQIEGVSSVLLKNVSTSESLTFTVHVLPSAVESLRLSRIDADKKVYPGNSVDLNAEVIRFNGHTDTHETTTLKWEFSADGGQTWQAQNELATLSSGIFIPAAAGVYSLRVAKDNVLAGLNENSLQYKTETVFSENTLVIEVEDYVAGGVEIDGRHASWHIPVSLAGSIHVPITYGGSQSASLQSTPSATATTSTPTPSPSASGNISGCELQGCLTEAHTKSAEQTQVTLSAVAQGANSLEWSAPVSDTGYLKDGVSEQICTEKNPCTGEQVVFYGGSHEGTSAVQLKNNETDEVFVYTIYTLPSAVKSVSLSGLDQYQYFSHQEISLQANVSRYNGFEEVVTGDALLLWEFSYDGGKTWQRDSADGNISAGVFLPKKEGTVLIRATHSTNIAKVGSGNLEWKENVFVADEVAIIVDAVSIDIAEAHLLGNNIITRNTNTSIVASLVSRANINELQSLSVGLFSGTIDAGNYDPLETTAFVFKEYHDQTPVKEYLEQEGDVNRGLVEIPVFIPEYDEKRYMKDGFYTFVVELYRNDRVMSRYFLPVVLGESFASCDVNGDGYENIIDAILSLKFLNGSLIPSDSEFDVVDKNQNGMIDLQDIVILFPCIVR